MEKEEEDRLSRSSLDCQPTREKRRELLLSSDVAERGGDVSVRTERGRTTTQNTEIIHIYFAKVLQKKGRKTRSFRFFLCVKESFKKSVWYKKNEEGELRFRWKLAAGNQRG